MENLENLEKNSFNIKSLFAAIVIIVAVAVSFLLFFFVLGDSGNFEGRNTSKHAINILGAVYKGGIIVPILMSFFLMVLTFTIERLITISNAYGKGSVNTFVRRVKILLSNNQINAALQECNNQKGAVGNATLSVLKKYELMYEETDMTKEQRISAIQKELEEATALEVPMLEKHLTIIATLASISTLVGLLGTVIGMIKAFAALATAGAPDAVALANGISEALINTALGIASSALAIVAYNYFTSKIDSLTYNIEEIGFTIGQTFAANYKSGVKSNASLKI